MEEETFEQFMASNGYDLNSNLSEQEKQVVRVASNAWDRQDDKILRIEQRIAIFKNAFNNL